MNTKFKYFLYDNHLWIIPLVVAIIFAAWFQVEDLHTSEFLVSAVAASVGLSYFLLKQQLEETRLFQELFTAFNNRYDNMNEKLSTLLGQSKGLAQDEKEQLCDYFNLCAEEYLYFEKGYIPPNVWSAWLNGMKVYFKDERIHTYWIEEASTASHYGLAEHLAEVMKETGSGPIGTVVKYAGMSKAA